MSNISTAKRPAPSTKGNKWNHGRQTSLNELAIEELKQALSVGVPITYAATHAGLCYKSVALWVREAESGKTLGGKKLSEKALELRRMLKAAIEEGKASFVNTHLTNISEQSKNDWKASAWSLSHAPETREQFSEAGRVRIEVEKRLAVAITVLQKELPPELFERVLVSMNEATLEAG